MPELEVFPRRVQVIMVAAQRSRIKNANGSCFGARQEKGRRCSEQGRSHVPETLCSLESYLEAGVLRRASSSVFRMDFEVYRIMLQNAWETIPEEPMVFDDNSTEQEVPYEFNGKTKENATLDYMSPSESSETTFSESSTTLTSQDEQEEDGRAVPTSNRKRNRQKLLRQRKRRNRESHLISGVNLKNFMQTMLSTITTQKEATREIKDQLTALKEQIQSQIIIQQDSTRKIFQYLLRMVEGEKHQENNASRDEIQSSLDKKKQCIQSLHTDLRKLVTEFHKQKLEMKMSSVKLTNCIMEKKELERLLTVAKEETHFYWEEYVRLRKQHLELLSKVRSKAFKKKYVNRKLCVISEAGKLLARTLAEIKKVISRNPRVSKKLSNATGS